MAVKLRVFFTGIVYLHRRTDGSWCAIMPDTEDYDERQPENEHIPVLLYEKNSLHSTENVDIEPTSSSDLIYWKLDKDFLKFSYGNAIISGPTTVEVYQNESNIRLPAVPDDDFGKYWNYVTPLRKRNRDGSRERGRIRNGIANYSQWFWRRKVNAAIDINGGNMRPVCFGNRSQPIVYGFSDNPNQNFRAYANVVLWESIIKDNNSDEECLKVYSHRHLSEDDKSISLKPFKVNGDLVFDLWFMNLERNTVYQNRFSGGTVPGDILYNEEYKIYMKTIQSGGSYYRHPWGRPQEISLVGFKMPEGLNPVFCEWFFKRKDGAGGQLQPCSPVSDWP